MSIFFNNSSINDWNFGDDNIIKVYYDNAVCYYKVISSGDTPTFDVCYAVVNDISQYQETEFEDVFNKADESWYKLNNLSQYEKYGLYGSGLTTTYYEGKLTIYDGYEYIYSGGSWVNVGEVSGSTATLPNVPFTVNYNAKNYDSTTNTLAKTSGQLADVDAVITAGTPTVYDDYLTIATNTRATIRGYQEYFNRDNNNPNLTIISKQNTNSGSNNYHLFANRNNNYNWMYRAYNNRLTLHGTSEQGGVAVTQQPVIESVRVDSNRTATYNNYTDNTSSSYNNFSYGVTNSEGTALFAGYYTNTTEWFSGDFYWIYMSQSTLTDEQVQQVIDYNEGNGGTTIYPLEYTVKSDPLDDLTFNTLEAAEEYAYNNCVYDGMKATIDGNKYIFNSEDGWVVVPEYYKVEDVTPNGASGWTITKSATYNPDTTYYDDFDLETTSTSNSYKIAKVTIFGYEDFTYYLRTSGYTSYNFVVATNVDELSTDPTSISYNDPRAITNTFSWNKAPKSAVDLSNYRRITYNNLDKNVEHTFYVIFYGRTYGSNIGNATILIPKAQTNENWEQVTFSASSNVASTQKNLYIDNNYSTSGGTQYFYYRWMVGLPSGSHSSYTNYSNYSYCPSVSSATFTSVAGDVRSVNYIYDGINTKKLQIRLVDSNSNVITPSETVYYTLYKYNACNISTNSTSNYPRSESMPIGGKFRFTQSSNRHYIYGYQLQTALNTDFYTDNYNNTFDIVYSKLNDEAVTITYVTYDPNDSETPTFNTEITYPYNGGTKVTTATTSYNVPYTYSYSVSPASNKYSAATQTFTAGQASRTVTFILYPNNREFASVADMEAYAYAWEGMQASVNGTDYKYTNGEWIEQSYTQYEYIQTQTGNYKYDFNTNFYPTTANTIELKFTLTGNSIDWGRILCWSSCGGDSCDSTQFRFTTVTDNYAIIGRKGNAIGTKYYTIGNGKTLTVTLPLSSSTYTYNTGSTNTTCNYNVGTFSLPSSTPMHILSLGYASDNRYAANVKLYYVKVYDGNGNLVKHYVPSDSNGAPCFYEKVNGEYITNTYSGSSGGTCTLGPEINT